MQTVNLQAKPLREVVAKRRQLKLDQTAKNDERAWKEVSIAAKRCTSSNLVSSF